MEVFQGAAGDHRHAVAEFLKARGVADVVYAGPKQADPLLVHAARGQRIGDGL